MRTVCLKVELGVQPPIGASFPVFAHEITGWSNTPGIQTVDTGIELDLPKDLALRVESAGGAVVMGYTLNGIAEPEINYNQTPLYTPDFTPPKKLSETPGRLVLLVWGTCYRQGDHIADVTIIDGMVTSVRFMEKGPQGGRVIRGEPKSADSSENTSPKS